jgi:Sec-independent protein translocase protein TatA
MKKLTLIFTFLAVFALVGLAPALAEEPAEKPPTAKTEKATDTKTEKTTDTKKEDTDEDIGQKLDSETVGELIANAIAASQNKGSFWRNPALWEVVFTIIMLILGFLAAKFGWNKKKWGKIIKSVEKAVNTVYVEFVREAKLKAKEAGGKLSKEDMKKALGDAWEMTKEDLQKQGIDLAKWVAKEYFPVVVDRIIKKVKK